MIYFVKPIGASGPIKIGYTAANNASERLEGLMRWSPLKLELVLIIPGGLYLERNIHDCLCAAHSHGEWFNQCELLDRLMTGLLAGKPVAECIDLSKRVGYIHSARFVAAQATRRANEKARAS